MNLVILKCISINAQRGSADLANLLRFMLAESRTFAGQKLELFQLRLSPRHLLLYSAHDVLLSGDSGFPNPHQKVLHGKFQRVKLSLQFGRIEQIHKEKHHSVVNVKAAHVCKGKSWKTEKGL